MPELLTNGVELGETAVDAEFHSIVAQLEEAELTSDHERELERTIQMKVQGRMDDGYSEEAIAIS